MKKPARDQVDKGKSVDAPVSAGGRRDWRRIHHSWLFWLGFCLFLAAIVFYLWSNDLSRPPRL